MRITPSQTPQRVICQVTARAVPTEPAPRWRPRNAWPAIARASMPRASRYQIVKVT